MKFLFWLLALFAAAVALALAANNPGYVLIAYPPYRIELSLTLFVLGFLALLVFAHFFLKLMGIVLRLPSHVRAYREQRSQNKSRTAMMEALTAYFEGRFTAAERAAVRAMESGENSELIYVIAARSAHQLREFDRRDSYLSIPENQTVGESAMRLIARTEFMLDQKHPELALQSLKELNAAHNQKHIGALQLELKAQQQAHNWDGVLAAITQLEKRSAINATLAEQARQQAWLEKLRTAIQDVKSLQTLWKSIPEEFKHRSKITSLAASNFIRLQDCKSALKLLTDSLNEQWDSELVTLYGDCKITNNIGQIEQAENWLKTHGDDAGLLLALGKLCLQQGLWGKAQNYLDASISLSPGSAAYAALAQLAEKLEKPGEASRYYQLALELK